MKRYDRNGGFLIMKDGAPYQAMYPVYKMNFVGVYCDGEYWLLPTDGPMTRNMALFVYETFALEILTEFNEAH